MPAWTFTVPDEVAQRVVDALCTAGGYQEQLPDGTPNPESRPQFAKRQVREWIKTQVVSHEAALEGERARAAAAEKARTEIDIS